MTFRLHYARLRRLHIPSTFRYTTYSPPPFRVMADETEDHRFGYIKRRDVTIPGRMGLAYKPRCSCKWAGQEFERTKAVARNRWHDHMAEVDKQGLLFLQERFSR